MIYFTSDLHLGHSFVANVRGFGPKYKNYNKAIHDMGEEEFNKLVRLEDHDKKIIRNLNADVGKNDELYILGDISSGSIEGTKYALNLIDHLHVIPSHRHLILGNHEGFKIKSNVSSDLFSVFGTVTVHDLIEVQEGIIAMSHYPLATSRIKTNHVAKNAASYHKSKYSIKNLPSDILHLHGHTHSRNYFDVDDIMDVNVGLDAWNLHPVSLDTILNIIL